MLSLIKADLLRIFTIRSTYIIFLISLLLLALIAYDSSGAEGASSNANALEVIATQGVIVAVFLSIVSILHMAHEYRYNTIMYMLTATASKTKVLLSKVVSISIFAVLFCFLTTAFSLVAYRLFLVWRGSTLVPQDFDVLAVGGKLLFFFIAYALLSLFIATIIRNLIGAIAFFLIVPNTVESILQAFWLKDNAVYLPFQSLNSVVAMSPGQLSLIETTIVATSYVIGTGLIAWAVLLKRDAN